VTHRSFQRLPLRGEVATPSGPPNVNPAPHNTKGSPLIEANCSSHSLGPTNVNRALLTQKGGPLIEVNYSSHSLGPTNVNRAPLTQNAGPLIEVNCSSHSLGLTLCRKQAPWCADRSANRVTLRAPSTHDWVNPTTYAL